MYSGQLEKTSLSASTCGTAVVAGAAPVAAGAPVSASPWMPLPPHAASSPGTLSSAPPTPTLRRKSARFDRLRCS